MNDFERLRATFKGLAFKQLGYAPLLDDEVDAGMLAVLREMREPSGSMESEAEEAEARHIDNNVAWYCRDAWRVMLDTLIAQAEASESKAAEWGAHPVLCHT